MAILLKIIRSVDYLDIGDDGSINFESSRKSLSEMPGPDHASVGYEILLDFRRTQWILSTAEIYDLVKVFLDDPGTFRDKIALLLLPGVNFDSGQFKELCARDKVNPVPTFTNFEDAIQWFYDRRWIHK